MSSMHIAVIKSVQNGKTYHSKLLRSSFRDDHGKVQKKTLANLSHLRDQAIDLLRAHLAGRSLVDPADTFHILRSRAHGSVQAVLQAFRQLGFVQLVASQPSPQRDLICALVAARILQPHSKLATARWWHSTTLPDHFDLRQAAAEDLYAAMDWLLQRQHRIQGKLARFGHNRDGKKGKLQVSYGLLCELQGRPVALTIFEGNVGDPRTVLAAVEQLRKRFGLTRVVLVGDRGMLVQTRLDQWRKLDGIDHEAALDGVYVIRTSLAAADLSAADCVRSYKALTRVERAFRTLKHRSAPAWILGRLQGEAAIGLRVGLVINHYKVASTSSGRSATGASSTEQAGQHRPRGGPRPRLRDPYFAGGRGSVSG